MLLPSCFFEKNGFIPCSHCDQQFVCRINVKELSHLWENNLSTMQYKLTYFSWKWSVTGLWFYVAIDYDHDTTRKYINVVGTCWGSATVDRLCRLENLPTRIESQPRPDRTFLCTRGLTWLFTYTKWTSPVFFLSRRRGTGQWYLFLIILLTQQYSAQVWNRLFLIFWYCFEFFNFFYRNRSIFLHCSTISFSSFFCNHWTMFFSRLTRDSQIWRIWCSLSIKIKISCKYNKTNTAN